jgi:hypothetical protein
MRHGARMKVVVAGMLSLPPFSPGTACDRLQYVLGLRSLGHEVLFVEEVDSGCCRDRDGRRCAYERSVNRECFCQTMADFGLLERSCQLYEGGRATAGLGRSELTGALEGADLLINISGHAKSDLVLGAVGRRAYLDQDPVYTQLWVAEYGADLGLDHHDVLFTVGNNIGTEASDIPTAGLRWHHTLPPVALDEWTPTKPGSGRFTTVASWGRYGDLSYRGRRFRGKRSEFRRFADLPARTGRELEVTLANRDAHPDDAMRLEQGGWTITDAAALGDLAAYRRYVAASGAEIGITKGAYVEGRAGWIGDRSCHYLASGSPVLLQSTGLERTVPTGRGLVTFANLDQAAEGVEEIERDHAAHCRAARELAEEVFDARRVLAELLETATTAPPARAEATP